MSETEYVRNAVVKMDWEREGFFESKKDTCFVAATELYETTGGDEICVIFKNNKAFLLYDEEAEGAMSREKFTEVLHDAIEEYGVDVDFSEIYEDAYIEVCNGAEIDQDIADGYGLDDEVCEDIVARCDDLSGYEVITYEDM